MTDQWYAFVEAALKDSSIPIHEWPLYKTTFFAGAAAYMQLQGQWETPLITEIKTIGIRAARSATPPQPDPSEPGAGAPT